MGGERDETVYVKNHNNAKWKNNHIAYFWVHSRANWLYLEEEIYRQFKQILGADKNSHPAVFGRCKFIDFS